MSITWQPGDNSPIRCPIDLNKKPKTRQDVASRKTKTPVVLVSVSKPPTVTLNLKRKREDDETQTTLNFPKREIPRNEPDEDVSAATLVALPIEIVQKKAKWYLITISKKSPSAIKLDTQSVAFLMRDYLERHSERRVGITHIHHFKSFVYPPKSNMIGIGPKRVHIILSSNCRNMAVAINAYLVHCGHKKVETYQRLLDGPAELKQELADLSFSCATDCISPRCTEVISNMAVPIRKKGWVRDGPSNPPEIVHSDSSDEEGPYEGWVKVGPVSCKFDF